MNKKVIIGVVVFVIVVLAVLVVFLYNNYSNILQIDEKEVETLVNEAVSEPKEVQEEIVDNEIKIFSGNERAIALMIDNNTNAQPQSGINSAYIVYEIIVEGNESRLMPVFKGVSDDLVLGPVRSVRHYFLDYMNENDAICAHLGQSPQAESDIKKFKMNDINGQIYDTGKARTNASLFWRVSHKSAPHNAYTSFGNLKQIATEKGFSLTSEQKSVLNYVPEEVNLESEIVANSVTIPYAASHKVKYEYNEETGRYTRYSKGKLQKDEATGEDVTTKNIIITLVRNYTLKDTENKGRQDLENVKEADGYYITNGKAIKITCKKDSRETQTVYLDESGNEINVNDGNTFINIVPIDSQITFE